MAHAFSGEQAVRRWPAREKARPLLSTLLLDDWTPARGGGDCMDTVTTIIILLGAFTVSLICYCKWRMEREICKALKLKASYVDAENFARQVAEWRYTRLKESIEAECQHAPKTLAALRLRIQWIENPPPESFRPQPQKRKRIKS